LAAAAELAQGGRSVLVLEARDRVGGRCLTLRQPGAAVPIELGAEFIHGAAEVTHALLRNAGTTSVDSSRVQRILRGGKLRPVDAFAEAKKAVQDVSALDKRDLSFARFLKTRKTISPATRTLASMMVEGFDAADPALASALAIAEEWGGGEMGAAQPRPLGGYGQALAWLAGSMDPARARLQLQSIVRLIRWRRGTVVVEGSFLDRPFRAEAKSAVVTLPLGVMQSGAVRFAPGLAEKREALRKLASGPVIKAALRFDRPFWEARYPDTAFFHSPGAAFPTFWAQLPMHSPVLIGWAGGPKAAALARLSRKEVLRKAMASLESIFPGRVGFQLQDALIQNWQADPFARGAYSYVLVGGKGAREVLAQSLRDTLFFAGEATDSAQAGTVAGALQSGQRAARELLERESR
jgi:monoamine oxidase